MIYDLNRITQSAKSFSYDKEIRKPLINIVEMRKNYIKRKYRIS
jgi:hypothetical protein